MSQFIAIVFNLEESGDAYYRQLYRQVGIAIREGRLTPGTKLPSSRLLAQELGISRSVVVQAYDQLLAEGILTSVVKKGLFVAASQMALAPDAVKVPTHDNPKKAWGQFDSGADIAVFPNRVWAASMRRSWLNPDHSVLAGEESGGYAPLKQALAQYLHQVRGLACVAEQIFIVAGNRDALTLIQHALRADVTDWYVEDPCYPPIRTGITQPKSLPIEEGGALPPQGNRWAAVLTPTRQYPLGMAYSSQIRDQWLDALQTGDGIVVEDDYDNEFVYQGKPPLPWAQVASLRGRASEQIFYVGSLSKVLFRGLRLGFLVVPPRWIQTVQQSQQALGNAASLPMQPVVADFMNNGEFYRHLNRMRRHYRQKRDHLMNCLERYLTPWFHWERPSGGMHCLILLSPEFACATVKSALTSYMQEKSVKLSWLDDHYCHGAEQPMGLVLGFTAPSEDNLTQWTCWLAEGIQRATASR